MFDSIGALVGFKVADKKYTMDDCCGGPIIKNHTQLIAWAGVSTASELFGSELDESDFIDGAQHTYAKPIVEDGELVGIECEHCETEHYKDGYQ